MLFFFFLLSTTRPTHPIQPFFLRPPGFSPAFFSLKFDVMIRSIQRGFWRTSFLAFILNFFLHHHSITHFFLFFQVKEKKGSFIVRGRNLWLSEATNSIIHYSIRILYARILFLFRLVPFSSFHLFPHPVPALFHRGKLLLLSPPFIFLSSISCLQYKRVFRPDPLHVCPLFLFILSSSY